MIIDTPLLSKYRACSTGTGDKVRGSTGDEGNHLVVSSVGPGVTSGALQGGRGAEVDQQHPSRLFEALKWEPQRLTQSLRRCESKEMMGQTEQVLG